MAEVNSDQAMQNTDSTPAVRRKLSLTPAEAMAEMDKLKDRVRSLSISSSVSAESTDSGSTGTGTRALVNVRKQDDLVSCLGVMRRLMEQAESESKRMREEKIVIAAKINTSLSAVNREVEYLKAELREQDKRLSELASTKLEQPAKAPEVNASGKRVSRSKLEIYKEDNDRLRCENEFLTKELNEWRQGNMDLDQLRQRLHSCEHEITRAKETISCMKVERKRLKTEKMTLLNQMKQVYGILEVKEAELREFIQNYEQRMREGEETIQRLEGEKRSWELERIDVLRESDSLRTQLALKEVELKDLEAELVEVKQHLAVLQSTLRENSSQLIFKTNNLNLDSTGGSVDSTSNSRNNQRSNTGQFFTDSSRSPVGNGESLPAPLKSSTSPIGGSASSDSQSDTSQVATPNDLEVFEFGLQCNNGEVTDIRKKKTRKSTSSISRLFSRGKQRKSVLTPIVREFPVIDNNDQLPTRSSFAEKKRVWEMHKDIPMVCWKANMVVAWLEVECQMPMYTQMCYENIKSGKLLLELKDSELEAGLGIGSVMHRWKLRLAIEQHRDPTSVKYPEISTVDHLWVSRVWIRGLGLSQYCSVFETNMVDGRMLNALTKKDMEKYLNVNKKFHQWSILHGVELLRMIDFNKEFLMERRRKSEENDSDPLVWTNERVSKWCRSVDLGEYADSLRDSGVHGALLVLDPSFGADELAQALGIHSSKNIIRRHLTSELASVLLPARSVVSTGNIDVKGAQKQKRKRSLSFNAGSRASVPSDLAKSPLKRGSFRDSFLFRSSSRNTPTRANSAGANISNSIYPDAPRRSYSRSSRARPKSSLQ